MAWRRQPGSDSEAPPPGPYGGCVDHDDVVARYAAMTAMYEGRALHVAAPAPAPAPPKRSATLRYTRAGGALVLRCAAALGRGAYGALVRPADAPCALPVGAVLPDGSVVAVAPPRARWPVVCAATVALVIAVGLAFALWPAAAAVYRARNDSPAALAGRALGVLDARSAADSAGGITGLEVVLLVLVAGTAAAFVLLWTVKKAAWVAFVMWAALLAGLLMWVAFERTW